MTDEEAKRKADQLRGFLAGGPINHGVADKQVLRELLLAGSDMMCMGRLRVIKTRALGAGVYKVWTAEWKEEAP